MTNLLILSLPIIKCKIQKKFFTYLKVFSGFTKPGKQVCFGRHVEAEYEGGRRK